jgi:hypothetical protein
LVLLHLPPLGGQDCNRLLLITLWLLVAVAGRLVHGQAVAVRVVLEPELHH